MMVVLSSLLTTAGRRPCGPKHLVAAAAVSSFSSSVSASAAAASTTAAARQQQEREQQQCYSTTTKRTTSAAATAAHGTCIVGAGLAGLATAIALERMAGIHNITLVERLHSDPLLHSDTAGAGAQLGPNGLRALRAIQQTIKEGEVDIVSQIMQLGTPLEKHVILTNNPDHPVFVVQDHTRDENEGLPQVLIRWSVLRNLLFQLAGLNSHSDSNYTTTKNPITSSNGNIQLYAGIDDIVGYLRTNRQQQQSTSTVVSPIRIGDETASPYFQQLQAPLIIGADGLYSTFGSILRTQWREQQQQQTDETVNVVNDDQQQQPQQPQRILLPPHANNKTIGILDGGRINIKAAVKIDLLNATDSHSFANKYPVLKDSGTGATFSWFSPDGSIACFAGPAGPGYTYWAISIADEKKQEGDEIQVDSEGNVIYNNCLSKARDTTQVKEKLLQKLHQTFSTPSPAAPGAPSSSTNTTTINVSAEKMCPFIVELMERTDPQLFYVARSQEREIGTLLVSQDGHVVLVGDAAHAMSPSYGQAANFAMEDAATLAAAIRDATTAAAAAASTSTTTTTQPPLHTALYNFSAARHDRCQEMQRRSAERTAKAAKGEPYEDISKWIFQWTIQ